MLETSGEAACRAAGISRSAGTRPKFGRRTRPDAVIWIRRAQIAYFSAVQRLSVARNLLLVIFDYFGRSYASFCRTFAGAAQCLPLTQKVPTLVQLHLNVAKPLVITERILIAGAHWLHHPVITVIGRPLDGCRFQPCSRAGNGNGSWRTRSKIFNRYNFKCGLRCGGCQS
jgi:hypothetical protein